MSVQCLDLEVSDYILNVNYFLSKAEESGRELKRVEKKVRGKFNPASTYIFLPDKSYFELARKDAIRLTDEELQLYVFKTYGLVFARDMKIVRGHVQ